MTVAIDIAGILAKHKVPISAIDEVFDALDQVIRKQVVQLPMELTSEYFIKSFLEHDFTSPEK